MIFELKINDIGFKEIKDTYSQYFEKLTEDTIF